METNCLNNPILRALDNEYRAMKLTYKSFYENSKYFHPNKAEHLRQMNILKKAMDKFS
jgi:hypothetical protein